eukprot:TRINITY_DN13660_c0_g1_i1.p1 TRINITY_DN13660_c0_g1~~TRINITY_DN13660_c0_g1_i1.p1  ORF type:complete len:187 (-),score=35.43 TRINITY_DN13660_c0_g1_i1:20-580(-)
MSEYKVVVIGSGAVGKSAMTIQFINQEFIEEYDPTIEDCYRKLYTIDGESCMLNVVDTAGQEEFRVLREQHIKSGQGYLIVYSVDNQSSFEEITGYHNEILDYKLKDHVPMVLCGNKCDLTIDRVISTEDGSELAKKFQIPFFETSALKNINVNESFFECVREIKKEYSKKGNEQTKKTSKLCLIL